MLVKILWQAKDFRLWKRTALKSLLLSRLWRIPSLPKALYSACRSNNWSDLSTWIRYYRAGLLGSTTILWRVAWSVLLSAQSQPTSNRTNLSHQSRRGSHKLTAFHLKRFHLPRMPRKPPVRTAVRMLYFSNTCNQMRLKAVRAMLRRREPGESECNQKRPTHSQVQAAPSARLI